jgi:F-type H+-transporting ATPase subunit b
MAEDKIAAEERAALEQLRATTADAARKAAARLIRERVDAEADEAIVGEAIRSIGSR